MQLTVLPLLAERQNAEFDLFEALVQTLRDNGDVKFEQGDVLVISTKYVSNSQGRVIDLDTVTPSGYGADISKKFQLRPEIAEVIIRESDRIFGGIIGFVLTSSATDSIMAPNAGIDRSNAERGKVILYPTNPYGVAEQIRRKIFLRFLVHVGVILADSRLMPARVGTSGVAVACAGMEPVTDMRAKRDLDGNPLKVTFQAVADNLATIANQQMGEGAESRPFAIIRDSGARLTDRCINPAEMAVPDEQCVYVRGLMSSPS